MSALLKIDSKPYGVISVKEEQKIVFVTGLFGLEDLKDYYILDYDNGPFYWLQSADLREVAFIIIDPCYFIKDYKLEVDRKDFIEIGLDPTSFVPEDLMQYAIVTIPPDDPSNMTANLLGPIIVNKNTRMSKQALSLSPEYTTRHSILNELNKLRGNNEEEG